MTEALIPGTTLKNGLVAESDLMYEAPDNTPEFDLKNAEKNFIDKLLAGQDPTEVEEPAPDYDTGESDYPPEDYEPETDAEQTLAPEDKPEEPEVDEIDPKLSRGVERLVARELAAKERETAAERKIAELKQLEASLAKYKDLKPTKDLAEMMDLDPYGALKSLGKDPDTVIKLALAQQLGDNAPASLKEFAKEASTKREIAQLKAQLAAEAQSRAAQEYFNTIHSGARQYVTSVGDSTPTLALVAKADPDYARDEIMEEIVSEAKRQAATDPNGEPISYEEAAKRVEKRFARLAKLINVRNGTTPANKTGTKPRVAPPNPKPAAKPLLPWQAQKTSVDELGIQEAIRAYEQAEAQRKMARR